MNPEDSFAEADEYLLNKAAQQLNIRMLKMKYQFVLKIICAASKISNAI